MARSNARTRYNLGILLCSAGYGLALVGGEAYFRAHPGANGVAAYAAAVIPALLIVAMFAVIGRYLVEEQDEYQRMLMVRQSLIASGLALSVATVWGFLESFALAPHVDAYWVAVLWFGGLGLGAVVNRVIEHRS